MLSTMQDGQLGIARLLRYVARTTGRSKIVSRTAKGVSSATFLEVAERAAKLASGLEVYGIQRGDMIASFMSASKEHLEVYLGVPYLGAVLHTVNIRLHADVIAQLCSEAGDKEFIVDDEVYAYFLAVVPLLESVRVVILVGDVAPEPLESIAINMAVQTPSIQ